MTLLRSAASRSRYSMYYSSLNMHRSKVLHRVIPNFLKKSYTTVNRNEETKRIGCASGFWGDTPTSVPQLVHQGNLDFLMFDYLSEITMSLLTAAKAKKPEFGYAPDFVLYALGPHLNEIKRKGIRILSNAGGINPLGCAAALKQATKKAGVDLKISVITGDNLMPIKDKLIADKVKDIQTNLPLPKSVHSMNAYLGAAPIAEALNLGADIVITGRCADSALALAPLMHSFNWGKNDLDLLASGSLAGHLIECGAQATGGVFTDWETVPDWHNIGFPIAEVSKGGEVVICKPPNTGGIVNLGTVGEQMLYEIGDPRAYMLPDVVCDFSNVKMKQVGDDEVLVTGAKGLPPTDTYKVSATYLDGFKSTSAVLVGGKKSKQKCLKTADAILTRCRNIFKQLKVDDFSSTHIQVFGAEDTYGPHASSGDGPREGMLWMSVQHKDKKALELFSREIAAAGTGMAPGITGAVGGRPKASPILKLHSFLVKKCDLKSTIHYEDQEITHTEPDTSLTFNNYEVTDQPTSVIPDKLCRGNQCYTLDELAYTRSGDKGDSCNIGIVARNPHYYPYILEALTTESVAQYFSHVFPVGSNPLTLTKRYEVPGIYGLNFILYNSLGGGGVASSRTDPQGKAYGQMLIDFKLHNMPDIDIFSL